MKLHANPTALLATSEPAPNEAAQAADAVDLLRLPWADGAFSAIELDDVPHANEWTVSGPALEECRRVLARHGLLEVRTRPIGAREAQATEKDSMRALTRLLQNHGFEIVSVEPVDGDGSRISALALRSDGPEDVFESQIAALATHVTLHAPLLDAGDESAANRALAASLDAQGVKIRVRVIFDVLDALFCE
jgi:hypothetical protein